MTIEQVYDHPEPSMEQLLDEKTLQEQAEMIESMSLEALLEDLDTLEQTTEFEDPDLSLGSSQPTFESLMGIVQDIQQTGLISRADAVQIQNLSSSLESFADIYSGALPLNSFTELPSHVNHEVAVESLLSSAGRFIIETIKKLIAAIRQAIRNGVNFFRQNVVTAKKAEQVSKRVSTTYKTAVVETKLKESVIEGDTIKLPSNIQIKLDALSVKIAEEDFVNKLVGGLDGVVEHLRPDALLISGEKGLSVIDGVVNQLIDPKHVSTTVTDALQGLKQVRQEIVKLNTTTSDIDTITLPGTLNNLARNINLRGPGQISQRMERMTRVIGELKSSVEVVDKEIANVRRTDPDDESIRQLEQRAKLLWGASLIMNMINDILGYLAGKLARCSKMLHQLQTA